MKKTKNLNSADHGLRSTYAETKENERQVYNGSIEAAGTDPLQRMASLLTRFTTTRWCILSSLRAPGTHNIRGGPPLTLISLYLLISLSGLSRYCRLFLINRNIGRQLRARLDIGEVLGKNAPRTNGDVLSCLQCAGSLD